MDNVDQCFSKSYFFQISRETTLSHVSSYQIFIVCYYQVDPERTREQDRILWNDGQLGPQVMKPQLADIQIVNDDRTLSSLYQPKQGNLQNKTMLRD